MAISTSAPASDAAMNTESPESDAAMSRFEAQTGRYGPITMIAGLILSLAGPIYLAFFSGLQISVGMIVVAFVAVAAIFGVLWFVEPLTYYPILGSAAMYQAFMIGNISNKLLPAVIVAQSTIGVKPGTRKANLASVMAIAGAAVVHLLSLFVFVGLLGTWLVTKIPGDVITVAQTYIVPALMGAVLVQAIVSMRNVRATVIAMVLALGIQLLVVPLFPALGMFATALVVVLSVIINLLARNRKSAEKDAAEPEGETTMN